MIPKDNRPLLAWASEICLRVTTEPTRARNFEALTQGDLPCEIYIGAGYWRLLVHADETGKVVGGTLANADRRPEEIATVEEAVRILMHIPTEVPLRC